MVIIKIPDNSKVGYREVCGNIGNLVLFCYTQQLTISNIPMSATLGVFLGVESVGPKRSVGRRGVSPKDNMKIGTPLTIKPYEKLGDNYIPMISRPNRPDPDYFIINRSLRELHFGKGDILDYLKKYRDFSLYSDLICGMKEPYLR